jgi:putative transposase
MSSTHASLDYHVVFSTKDRRRTIDIRWRDDLHQYLGGCIRTLGGVASQVGGTDDHVHIALGLKPRHSVADVLRDIKHASSSWVHDRLGVSAFAWQEGYGAFTFSRRSLDSVARYIATQEEHHRKRSFQEEYRGMLEELGIAFDERYLW